MDAVSVFTKNAKLNGGRSIPMPKESLTDALQRTASIMTTKTPPQADKPFLEKYLSFVLAIVLAVVPAISTFAVMQWRISALEEKHKSDIDGINVRIGNDKSELNDRIANDKVELNARIADAQAYGNSALGQSKFIQGILLGKGILNANEINQIQSQNQK